MIMIGNFRLYSAGLFISENINVTNDFLVELETSYPLAAVASCRIEATSSGNSDVYVSCEKNIHFVIPFIME